MTATKWDRRFLDLAYEISKWSKDPSSKVGAVIVRPDKTIAALGYNGFPRGMDDSPELYNDRNIKYARVVHGEINAILSSREPLKGYTLYTVPFFTCDRCAVQVIQAGITHVVSPFCSDPGVRARFQDAWDRAAAFYKEAGVSYHLIPNN